MFKRIIGAAGFCVLLGAGGMVAAHAQSETVPVQDAIDQIEASSYIPEIEQVLGGLDRIVQAAPPPAAPVIADDTFDPQPRIDPGQTQTVELPAIDGASRRYVIHVGSNYNPEKPQPIPVLFAFHGWRQSIEEFMESSRFHTTAAWDDAIVIYPEGVDGAWESAPYATGRPGKDIAYVQQILAQLDDDYLVDKHRIYAAGFSNGGGMAAVLGCHAPGTFAAFASVAGAYYQPVNLGCKTTAIPSMVIHANDDPIVSYRGGPRNRGKLLPALEVSHQYAYRNGCDATPPAVSDVPGGQRLSFNGCSAATQHVRFNSAEHIWVGGEATSDMVWDFLSAQSR